MYLPIEYLHTMAARYKEDQSCDHEEALRMISVLFGYKSWPHLLCEYDNDKYIYDSVIESIIKDAKIIFDSKNVPVLYHVDMILRRDRINSNNIDSIRRHAIRKSFFDNNFEFLTFTNTSIEACNLLKNDSSLKSVHKAQG
jgi:hypothetical protein